MPDRVIGPLRDDPLHPFRIERMWALIVVGDDPTGRPAEGLPAIELLGVPMPCIAADEVRVEQLRQWAPGIARNAKRRVVLVRFEQRVELEVFEP